MEDISGFLDDEHWYSQSIHVRKCKTVKQVERYLTEHCYQASEAKQLVKEFKELQNENKNN
jgi:hypothetical protein